MELGLTLKSYGPPTLGIILFTHPANNTDQVDSEIWSFNEKQNSPIHFHKNQIMAVDSGQWEQGVQQVLRPRHFTNEGSFLNFLWWWPNIPYFGLDPIDLWSGWLDSKGPGQLSLSYNWPLIVQYWNKFLICIKFGSANFINSSYSGFLNRHMSAEGRQGIRIHINREEY